MKKERSNELGDVLANIDSDAVDFNLDRGDADADQKVYAPDDYRNSRLSTAAVSWKTPPRNGLVLWCPFCDEWTSKDSMINRKRLGLHISGEHPEEVRFKKGEQPPELTEEF